LNAVLPRTIGRYVVDREIGRGGMGVIYKAHDPAIDRAVAIKLIRAELLGDDGEEFILRFQREAQAAARCAHPNIVAIYDFAVEGGSPYLTMEYLEGETLGQALAGGRRFSIEEAVSIITQVLDGLSIAHAHGIVHRDIKPANILLLDKLRVKVMDFGIARPAASDLTQAGALVGSPHYMSPEQFRGDPVDHRADLFAAGVVLYQLITGERPFAGNNFAEIAYRVVHSTPDPGPRAASWPGLNACLGRALAKSAADRWPNAEMMAAALRGVITAGVSDSATVIVPPAAPPPVNPAEDSVSGRSQTVTVPGAVPAALRALAEHELARFVGPIAKVLVKRALPSASCDAFRRTLAAHLDKDADRAAFLSRTRSGWEL
jgi:serine/threonine-protein kinase